MNTSAHPINDRFAPACLNENNLRLRGIEQQNMLNKACEARDVVMGKEVFVRAVIEVSNFCRQNCSYCGMRRDNSNLQRFRMQREELRDLVFNCLPPSVTDINFQTGEDPVVVREVLLPLIHQIASETNLGISLCLGTLSPALYNELRQAGAAYYIIKIETGNSEHYRTLQAPATLEKRLEAINELIQAGWFVSSGFISGLPGESPAQVLETMRLLGGLSLSGVSVSPFIPGLDTPTMSCKTGDIEDALNCLAIMRLSNPSRIIPAVSAFNILQPGGYVRALKAGANLVTINLTPPKKREKYVLYRANRFIMTERLVLDAIAQANCEVSPTSLIQWLQKRREQRSAIEVEPAGY